MSVDSEMALIHVDRSCHGVMDGAEPLSKHNGGWEWHACLRESLFLYICLTVSACACVCVFALVSPSSASALICNTFWARVAFAIVHLKNIEAAGGKKRQEKKSGGTMCHNYVLGVGVKTALNADEVMFTNMNRQIQRRIGVSYLPFFFFFFITQTLTHTHNSLLLSLVAALCLSLTSCVYLWVCASRVNVCSICPISSSCFRLVSWERDRQIRKCPVIGLSVKSTSDVSYLKYAVNIYRSLELSVVYKNKRLITWLFSQTYKISG